MFHQNLLSKLFVCTLLPLTTFSTFSQSNTYLHIAHTRTDINPVLIDGVSKIDYSVYDMLWLGGDLTLNTSGKNKYLKQINMVFDVKSKSTLWSLGNHDYTDLRKLNRFIKRPSFYSVNRNRITFIILDTQDSLSNIVGEQLELFKSVIDTIENSTHLILLHHKLIWMDDHDTLRSKISKISNGYYGECFHCLNENNFYSEIYPRLVLVKQKGIKVLCIAGDIGHKAQEFEIETTDGIYFLASGMSESIKENRAIVFSHNIATQELRWEYRLIKTLQ